MTAAADVPARVVAEVERGVREWRCPDGEVLGLVSLDAAQGIAKVRTPTGAEYIYTLDSFARWTPIERAA